MRFLMVFLGAAAALRAQDKVEPKVEEVKVEEPKKTPPKVCSIPLLVVRPKAGVDPKMAIEPKVTERFQIREVVPPAPACDSVRWK